MPSPHPNVSALSIDHELIDTIVDGRYGTMLSHNRKTRLLRVAEIASLYTRQELLSEIGFSSSNVATIQKWLTSQRRQLRDRREPIEAAICRLDIGSCRTAFPEDNEKVAMRLVLQQMPADSLV